MHVRIYTKVTLLKMESLGNFFVGALSAVTNNTSKRCLKFFQKMLYYTPKYWVGRKVSILSTIYANIKT